MDVDKNLDKISLTSDDLEEYAKERKIKMTIFFDNLEIVISNSQNAYMPDLSVYDEKRNRFDKVIIYMTKQELGDCPSSTAVASILTHELTHAYEDFKRNEKHLDWTMKDLAKDPVYMKAQKMMSNPKNVIEKFVGNMLYVFNRAETNAFYSEFCTLLDSLYDKDTVISYSDALKEFKENEVYKSIVSVISILETANEDALNYVRNCWNDVNNDNLTTNKCVKKLKFLANKRFQKMTEVLPKIYFDWISKEENRRINRKKKDILCISDPIISFIEKITFFREIVENQLS